MLNLGFICKALHKLLSYFFSDHNFQTQTLWFKKALCVIVSLKCLYWLYYFQLYFGDNSIIYFNPGKVGPFKDLAFLLYNLRMPLLNAGAIVLLLIISLSRLFYNKFPFFPELLCWFILINIHNQVYSTLTGGDYLLNQLLFFNCFLANQFTVKKSQWFELKKFIHNLSVEAIKIQLCVAYLLAGLAKLFNQTWLNGDAISLITQTKHFSLFAFPEYHANYNWFYVFLNWLVLLYQLLFPVLAWFGFFKKPLIGIGLIMHLYIALIMGLPWFAITMILPYIFFWPKLTHT
jgi:hypothetical protein